MREVAEFRVDEDFAPMLFGDPEGEKLSSVRRIEMDTTDPRFAEIGRLQTELRVTRSKPFFYGWRLRRYYARRELEAASLFRLIVTSYFEPAGEECGTTYDEATACPCCGAGAQQTGPLCLNVRRIPKGKDIAETIASEVVVSRRLAELFRQHHVTGAEFLPVRVNRPSGQESSEWFQLKVSPATANVVPPTRVGNDPFDDDPKNEGRCERADLIGLNMLSAASIDAATRGDADIFCSRQYIGVRRGLLRPERLIFLAPRVWRLIASEKLRGGRFEVADLRRIG